MISNLNDNKVAKKVVKLCMSLSKLNYDDLVLFVALALVRCDLVSNKPIHANIYNYINELKVNIKLNKALYNLLK